MTSILFNIFLMATNFNSYSVYAVHYCIIVMVKVFLLTVVWFYILFITGVIIMILHVKWNVV